MEIKWVRNIAGNYETEKPNSSSIIEDTGYALMMLKLRKDKKWSCHTFIGMEVGIENEITPQYALFVPHRKRNELGIYKTIRDAKADIQLYADKYLK